MKLDSNSLPDSHAAEARVLGALVHLARRARHAASAEALGFVAVNETHALFAYRQAALWFADRGIVALSGVVSPEANAPYVQWLERLCAGMPAGRAPQRLGPGHPLAEGEAEVAAEVLAEWADWLPGNALWLPLPARLERASDGASSVAPGALLLVRDAPWSEGEQALLGEWAEMLADAWARLQQPTLRTRWGALRRHWGEVWPGAEARRQFWRRLGRRRFWRLSAARAARAARRGGALLCRPRQWGAALRQAASAVWRSPRRRYAALLAVFLLFPVRLTVLAPGELVPAHPAVVRAPLDGSVDRFFVAPNQRVAAGAPLFQLDLTQLESRLEIARQALVTAEAEYRQAAQQAVFEAKSKAQLALLQGRLAERRTETDFLEAQLARAQIAAPRDGIVLMDDPSEWVGKPVVVGERILTVADAHDVEVEAWIALGDAILLPDAAAVTLYLNAAPLSPVAARLRYYAHDAVARPDGSYAYRVRARLDAGETPPRVGMKGTAKIKGPWVTLGYWVLRRPLAMLRQASGL